MYIEYQYDQTRNSADEYQCIDKFEKTEFGYMGPEMLNAEMENSIRNMKNKKE